MTASNGFIMKFLFNLSLILMLEVGQSFAPAGPAYPAGTTSLQKCAEWGRLVYREEYPLPGDDFPSQELLNVSLCHLELPSDIVVGGETVAPSEFPHMAAIGFLINKSKRWRCGGSLISPTFVLTAAHCVNDPSTPTHRGAGPARWVLLGAHDLSAWEGDPNSQELPVERRITHPLYQPDLKYHDVGLLQLVAAVRTSETVRPACLHTLRHSLPRAAIATGWGALYEGGQQADLLQKVKLSLVPQEACRKHFDPVRTPANRPSLPLGIQGSQLCAGGAAAGGEDTCAGDSGGPLQVLQEEPYCTYAVVGVTSFGRGCARPGLPAVYTRVAEYVPWIESVVWPEGPDAQGLIFSS